jgi:hypothetical protein
LGLEQKLSKSKSKEDDSDSPQLIFSPTLRYVAHPQLSPPAKFKDRKSGRSFQGQVERAVLLLLWTATAAFLPGLV